VVLGSFCYGYSGMSRDFDSGIDLIASGKVPAAGLVTHCFPLTDVRNAFEAALDKGSPFIKVMLCRA
jgi:threonine dehydrogenase-like Zn-dependent dehydrogenase